MSAVTQQMLLASGSAPATISYLGAYTPSIGTVVTQTGVNFGAAASQRLIIVAVHYNAASGGLITSATIGGVSVPTIIPGLQLGSSSPFLNVSLIAAYVPTGTSGTISIAFNGSSLAYLFVYQAQNIQNASPVDSSAVISSTSPTSTTCNLKANGIVLAIATTLVVSSPFTFSGVTEDYETSTPSGSGTRGGGSALTPSAVTGATIQMSDPGGPAGGPFRTMLVASFR
jgi:hypothetical protein